MKNRKMKVGAGQAAAASRASRWRCGAWGALAGRAAASCSRGLPQHAAGAAHWRAAASGAGWRMTPLPLSAPSALPCLQMGLSVIAVVGLGAAIPVIAAELQFWKAKGK